MNKVVEFHVDLQCALCQTQRVVVGATGMVPNGWRQYNFIGYYMDHLDPKGLGFVIYLGIPYAPVSKIPSVLS